MDFCETCLLKDGLHCLKQLSLYLQDNDADVILAIDHIDNLREKLLALKVANGKTLNKFFDSFAIAGCYKGVPITKNESDDVKFVAFRSQFFKHCMTM